MRLQAFQMPNKLILRCYKPTRVSGKFVLLCWLWFFLVSPFIDRDADVLMDILAPRRRNFLDRPNQSSSTTAVSSSATSEAEPEPDKG